MEDNCIELKFARATLYLKCYNVYFKSRYSVFFKKLKNYILKREILN